MACNPSGSSSFDHLLLQSLMGRLQLRPPYLDTNSFLSHSLDDFLLRDELPSDDEDDEEEEDGELTAFSGDGARHRRHIGKEEARLEKEIIKIVHSGNAKEKLKANSGQSVSIGDHDICIGAHEEPGSEYRVWEWHGHIMLFDEENGYSAEYIYGNYFERLPDKKGGRKDEEEEDDEEGTKVKAGANSGLRDLIGDSKDPVGNGEGRVLHRNSRNSGTAAR
ncbi:uncharacterized protein LOC103705948 [Phoenix dactylifera]|uniref:Uncharacterized protein LOC103705948 n=1 Tax=Phoenix dactylifera TaxID=42345 RepID=A0A8B7BYQ3_PHODC|nr:uncharacterized protein LOC103705948 [Phoenix dactylifera]